LILSLLVIFSMLLGACAPAVAPAPADAPAEAEATEPAAEEAAAEPAAAAGEGVPMVLMPKFLGILVFDQANQGAQEAHAEVGNPAELQFLGPTPENSVAGQIEILTNATTQGVKAIMISNNAGDQIAPAAEAAARDAGMTVVTWDSPIPSARGRGRSSWRRSTSTRPAP
jgi:rhamnose transport system substrate-binding protein